jgi:hypothetical protein
MRVKLTVHAVGLAIAAATWAPFASAQLDAATARTLFDEGRRLAASNQFEAACPKFQESYRLDPGMGTLFNLADCWEHIGRTASAWAAFLQVADEAGRSKQPDREKIARTRAAALEPKLSRLLVKVESKDAGLELSKDGTSFGAAQWGSALPIDPGQHIIEAKAPSKQTWRARVQVPPGGQTVTVVIPALTNDTALTPAVPVAAAQATAPPATAPPVANAPPAIANPSSPTGATPGPADTAPAAAQSQPAAATAAAGPAQPAMTLTSAQPKPQDQVQRGSGSQATVGWMLGGVGVAGVAIGTYFGLQVNSKNKAADQVCPTNIHCTIQDRAAYNSAIADAKSDRTISIVGLALGGAALTSGFILILSAPKSNTTTTGFRVSPSMDAAGRVGATLQGAW